jgi:hypothetical protein
MSKINSQPKDLNKSLFKIVDQRDKHVNPLVPIWEPQNTLLYFLSLSDAKRIVNLNAAEKKVEIYKSHPSAWVRDHMDKYWLKYQ